MRLLTDALAESAKTERNCGCPFASVSMREIRAASPGWLTLVVRSEVVLDPRQSFNECSVSG